MKTTNTQTKPAEGTKSADSRQCFDLTNAQIELGGSELTSLCAQAGYSSLRSYLNEQRLWSHTVADVTEMLSQAIKNNSYPTDFGDDEEDMDRR